MGARLAPGREGSDLVATRSEKGTADAGYLLNGKKDRVNVVDGDCPRVSTSMRGFRQPPTPVDGISGTTHCNGVRLDLPGGFEVYLEELPPPSYLAELCRELSE